MTLPGVKVLTIGESGVGKTHAIRTLLRTGIQPYVLATEPGMRALAPCDLATCAICRDTRDKPPIPWAYVPPTPGDVDILIKQSKDVNTKSLKDLCSINDTQRGAYDQFTQVLTLIKEFKDHGGVSHGSVHGWGTDRALVIDSWTGLGDMSMDLFCGKRPAYDKSDYQVAQKGLKNFAKLLTMSLRCHVIVLGHVEREFDDISGGVRLTISTVGAKLAPLLPPMFDDMPLAMRRGDKFEWSTAEMNVMSKGRNLPIKAGLAPDYGQIVESWKRAGGVVEPTK